MHHCSYQLFFRCTLCQQLGLKHLHWAMANIAAYRVQANAAAA